MSEPITLYTETTILDGVEVRTVMVEVWPRETSFDDALFEQTDPSMLTVDGDMVTLRVANGQATYQIGELSLFSLSHHARLVSSRLTATSTQLEAVDV